MHNGVLCAMRMRHCGSGMRKREERSSRQRIEEVQHDFTTLRLLLYLDKVAAV